MSVLHSSKVPEGFEIYTSPKGARYIIRNDKRVYISEKPYVRKNNYTVPRGAFARYANSQISRT